MDALFSGLISVLTFFIVFVLTTCAIIAAGVVGYKFYIKLRFQKVLENSRQSNANAVLLVKIPPNSEEKEAAMETFLHSLHQVLPDGTLLSLEMASENQFLRFCIVIPRIFKGILESQLYAQYPEAEVEEVQDYIPVTKQHTAYVQLNFKKSSVNPINTYQTMQEDLLKKVSAVLAKTEPDEKVSVQLSLRKIGSKSWDRGIRALYLQYFKKQNSQSETPRPMYVKLGQDLYLGKLRLSYTAANQATADAKLATLLGLYKGLKSTSNFLKPKKLVAADPLFKTRLFETGDLWSCAELATVYHFAYKGNVVSNVVNTSSKRAPAPDILPILGQVDPKQVSFIGETNYRSEQKKFGIKRLDRRRHLYVVGKTGGGKSKLLELLLLADIQTNQGCCLLDPHGDLADEILKFIPYNRINDVVYVNPADRNFPIGFNPLEAVEDYEARQHLATFFIAIFKKMFAASWNARMEHLIRYTTLALLETPDSSVLGIPRMLSDTAFRQRVIKQIQDPVVKAFWTNEFSAGDHQFNNEAVIPILNKVGQFIANPIIRNMVGQRKNVLDFEKFMNEGKIVILNISKGKLGEENAALLGSMIITKIQQAALARAKVPEEDRRDFYFYVDEFQNFATDAFKSILSEARKYHLNLTIAHQYIAQLPDEVKATAFGNVGSMICFAVGGDDAAYLAKEFTPVFTPDDLVSLNAREMYLKMSIDGKITPPFSARTLTVPKSVDDYSIEIVDKSRTKYGRVRVEAENEIAQWSQSSEVFPNVVAKEGEEFPEPLL